MAILKVARMGHPVLRARAAPIAVSDIPSRRVQQLVDDMFETMAEYGGIGLAAPQVHESVRLFVAGLREAAIVDPMTGEDEMPFVAIINPELTPAVDTIEEGWEGCLSIPDIRGKVPRPAAVRVRGWNRQAKRIEFIAQGLPARVVQHETDHLDGVLFFDRMTSHETLTFLDEFKRYWAKDDED
jgi:peptide deformylase